MINPWLCCFIYALQIYPQNPNLEHYVIVPPLGRIKSLAASPFDLFAVNDGYLLIFNRPDLTLQRTVYFEPPPDLIAYDAAADELWITTAAGLIRYNRALGTVREYKFSDPVDGLACGSDKIYLLGPRKYALDKITGEIGEVNIFPSGLKWSRRLTDDDLRRYRYLSPFYYRDGMTETQDPEARFPITAMCDDGMELFVGTDGYGILKYNTVSWRRDRLIFGPLDVAIRRVRTVGGAFFFISRSGISRLDIKTGKWDYRRLNMDISDLLSLDSSLVVTDGNRVSFLTGTLVFPIRDFSSAILAMAADNQYLYIGTGTGMFRIERGTSAAFPFGPDGHPVYAIAPVGDKTYVGTEYSLYRYLSPSGVWDRIFPRGVKKVIPVGSDIFFLSMDNQLLRYLPRNDGKPASDSDWVLLPFFNIYDIETDNSVLYCASYNGLNYFEPGTGLYKPIYDLPRQKYNSVLVADQFIFALSDNLIYRLPISGRDR